MNIFMTKPFKKVITACVIALTTQAYSVLAANQNTQLAYHIEMIIFERTSAAFSAPEYWPENIVLTYPPNYRVILTQEESLALVSNEPPLNAEINAEGNYQVNEQATKEENSPITEITQAAQNTQTPAAISQRILLKRPNNSYVLTNEANAINRKSTMRVLFHKAWQQRLDSTAKAPSVIINGGDTFDSRTELGGSIRFSVNKFIHVDTQLWLARFTPNYGQELNWPIPPMAPTAINTQRTTFDTLNLEDTLHFKQDTLHFKQDTQNFGITTQTVTSALNYLNPTHSNPTHSNPTYSNQEIVSNNTYSGTIGLQNHLGNNLLANEPQASLGHLTDQVITLKQSRRMRSKELHYIDHPRLGILVKVIPIALDEML